MASGSGMACCPYTNAVCCSDGEHCCPFNSTCDVPNQRCMPAAGEPAGPAFLQAAAAQDVIVCPDRHSICSPSQTCCAHVSGGFAYVEIGLFPCPPLSGVPR
jgi:hypothetical protein